MKLTHEQELTLHSVEIKVFIISFFEAYSESGQSSGSEWLNTFGEWNFSKGGCS